MPNKKKSTNLKLLEGTHKVSRDGEVGEPQDMGPEDQEPKIVKKPTFVKGKAAKHWRRIVPLMQKHGLLSDIDSDQLARYCILLSRYYKAEVEIAKEGEVIMMVVGKAMNRAGRPSLGNPEQDPDDSHDPKKNLKDSHEVVYKRPTKNPWVAISKDCSQELRRYEKAMRMTNDSNPDLHAKPKGKKGAKKGAERFFK